MENNKKRAIIIGSIVGVIALILVIVGVVYSKGNEKKVEVATVEASTEASTKEVVEAVTETSQETTETITVEAVANASASTETVQTSTQSKGSVGWPNAEGGYIPNNTHGWPVISNYTGSGRGPGEAWVGSCNYPYITNVKSDDPNSNEWDWVTIVTASNGVKVKCFEATNSSGNPIYIPINDGTGADLQTNPNSPWMDAIMEIGTGGDAETTNYWNSSSGATLPTTSFKRNSIDASDANVVAFKQTFEAYASQITDSPQLVVNASGFAFYDVSGKCYWSITHDGSEWVVRLNMSPATRSWEAMKEIMHYVSPSGDALYAGIYDDFYIASEADPIENFNQWYPVGSAEIYQPDLGGNAGYALYYFR